MKRIIIAGFICVLCLICTGCGDKEENSYRESNESTQESIKSTRESVESKGELVESSDGYIYVSCDVYHKFRNDIIAKNIYEFDEKYDGKKFAITGTLRYNVATDNLILWAGDKRVQGGSNFDYSGILRSLGVNENMDDYDGKNVIIRATFRQGEMHETLAIKKYGYLEDCTIELE